MYLQVNLGGEFRGLKFNNGAIDIYFERINFEEVNASAIYAAFYAGLVGNCIAKGVDHTFTFEQVTEWVDDLANGDGEADIVKVCEMIAETNGYKRKLQAIQDKIDELVEPAKKKSIKEKRSTKTTSSHSAG